MSEVKHIAFHCLRGCYNYWQTLTNTHIIIQQFPTSPSQCLRHGRLTRLGVMERAFSFERRIEANALKTTTEMTNPKKSIHTQPCRICLISRNQSSQIAIIMVHVVYSWISFAWIHFMNKPKWWLKKHHWKFSNTQLNIKRTFTSQYQAPSGFKQLFCAFQPINLYIPPHTMAVLVWVCYVQDWCLSSHHPGAWSNGDTHQPQDWSELTATWQQSGRLEHSHHYLFSHTPLGSLV